MLRSALKKGPQKLAKDFKQMAGRGKKIALASVLSPVKVDFARKDHFASKKLISVQKFKGQQKQNQWMKTHQLKAQTTRTFATTKASIAFKNGAQAHNFLKKNRLLNPKQGTSTRITIANSSNRIINSFQSRLLQNKRSSPFSTVSSRVPKSLVKTPSVLTNRLVQKSHTGNFSRHLFNLNRPQAMAYNRTSVINRTNVEMRKISNSSGSMRTESTITHHNPKTTSRNFSSQGVGGNYYQINQLWAKKVSTQLLRPSIATTFLLTQKKQPRFSLQTYCTESPKLEGSQTHQNLCDAFAGESCANRRYLFFASKADIEGHPEIASLFRSTAEGETGHAHGHLYFLEEVGDPATSLPMGGSISNLKSAVAGETHEYTDMYPGMAKTARDEGFDEIADWFETLAMAEKSHAGKFQKALEKLESGSD